MDTKSIIYIYYIDSCEAISIVFYDFTPILKQKQTVFS